MTKRSDIAKTFSCPHDLKKKIKNSQHGSGIIYRSHQQLRARRGTWTEEEEADVYLNIIHALATAWSPGESSTPLSFFAISVFI